MLLKEKVEKVLKAVPGPRDQTLKIIEKPGMSVKSTLCKNNPRPRKECNREACPLMEKGCDERCTMEGVGYVARCVRCWTSEGGGGGGGGEGQEDIYR